MSRVGKQPIALPKGVSVVVRDNAIVVAGPKGELKRPLLPQVTVEVTESTVVVGRTSDDRKARGFHGLYRQLVNNMVVGVSEGFKKSLLINGVGYRAELKGASMTLNLGYSNPIEFMIPAGIEAELEGPAKVTVRGIDKELVGQTAADIRGLRPPEPYKGKGIRYENEYVRSKVGKSGIKK